jgi:hypothetical protein
MSRRKRRPAAPETSGEVLDRQPPRSVWPDLALLALLVAATVGVAELAGAANLGVALGIGQVVFAVALVVLLIRA